MSALPIAWMAETLLASSLLMAAVLVLRRPTARLFGPRVAYLLWVLPALRMVLPPLPRREIAEVPVGIDISAIRTIEAAPSITDIPALSRVVGSTAIDWVLVALLLWVLGAVLHLGWHFAAYRRFLADTAARGAPLFTLQGVTVHSAQVSGPAAAGIVHRRILLPHDFADRFDAEEQRLALAHELAHHRRGDLLANWIALGILSLHWFNPFAYAAYRAFRADQELACDATVLTTSSPEQLHAYATALVKATWDGGIVAACPLNHADQLKRRLKMMKARRKTLARTLLGIALAMGAVACGLALTASSSAVARSAVVAAVEPALAKSLAFNSAISGEAHDIPVAEKAVSAATLPAISLPDPATAIAYADLPKLEVQSDSAPSVQLATSTTPSVKMMRYVLYDSPVEHVVPSNKALIESMMAGSGPNGEPVDLFRLKIEGLSVEEAIALGKQRNVWTTPAGLYEGPWSGSATYSIEWGRRRSRDARVAPSAAVAKAGLDRARVALASALRASAKTKFRYVRAAYAPGLYNSVSAGSYYVGFCGEIHAGGALAGWKPFFVSETPTISNGSPQQLFFGEAATARCGGRRSAEDYTPRFEAIAKAYELRDSLVEEADRARRRAPGTEDRGQLPGTSAARTAALLQPIKVVNTAPPPAGDHQIADVSLTPAAIEAALSPTRRALNQFGDRRNYRSVHAVIAPGALNANAPGVSFIGFCGEISVTKVSGGGANRNWQPFFASGAPAAVNGYKIYVVLGGAVPTLCSGPRSAEEYGARLPRFSSSNTTTLARSSGHRPF